MLDQTFNDVDLVGRPLSLGNFVSSNSLGTPGLTSTTNIYSPYLDIGDLAYDPSQDTIVRGEDYQEVLTNSPLGSQVLTGLFLNVSLSGPAGATENYERTLVDRIGYDVRQNGGTPALSIDPSGPPVIGPDDVWTISVSPSLIGPTTNQLVQNNLQADLALLSNQNAANATTVVPSTLSEVLIGQTRDYLTALLGASDAATSGLAGQELIEAYFDRPQITIVDATVSTQGTSTALLTFEADLERDTIRAIAYPGQATSVLAPFQGARGLLENAIETDVFPQPAAINGLQVEAHSSTTTVFQAAATQGIPLVAVTPASAAVLDTLMIDPVAKARITTALLAGDDVVVPSQDVTEGGTATVAWFETDPESGLTVGVGEDGAHDSIAEYALVASGTLFFAGLNSVVNSALGSVAADVVFRLLASPISAQIAPLVANHEYSTTKYNNADLDYSQVKQEILERLTAEVNTAIGVASAIGDLGFPEGFDQQIMDDLNIDLSTHAGADPPLPAGLLALPGPLILPSTSTQAVTESTSAAAGEASGTTQSSAVSLTGAIQATWSGQSTASFLVGALTSVTATVRGAGGATVAMGTVGAGGFAGRPGRDRGHRRRSVQSLRDGDPRLLRARPGQPWGQRRLGQLQRDARWHGEYHGDNRWFERERQSAAGGDLHDHDIFGHAQRQRSECNTRFCRVGLSRRQ